MNQPTAAYIRVSTTEQKLHGLSLDAQRDTLKRYAETHGLKIVEWYEDEGISGRKEVRKRPALQRMMNDAEKDLFTRIIFIKLDRYFRSVGEYYACQKILDKHHILWSATNEDYDLTTATGRLLVSQKLAIAEYEADNTSERIKLVNEYKVRNGQPLTGSMPLGFKISKTDSGKRIIIDKETEHIVRDAINYYISHQALNTTLRYINSTYGLSMTHLSLKTLFQNTMLYGSYRGNDNYCDAYIDKVTFDNMQSTLNKNIKKAPTNRIYLFTGLIKCPVCGNNMAARASGYKLRYFYYRCRQRTFHRCDYRRELREENVEEYLLNTLDERMNYYVTSVGLSDVDTRYQDPDPTMKEIARLNKMFQKGRISEKAYDREYAILEQQLKEISLKNKEVGKRDVNRYIELLKSDWKSVYSSLDREHKRSFWRQVIKEIHIDENASISDILFF